MSSSKRTGPSSYTRVAMLKHLLDGRSVDFAAAAAGMKRDQALEVAEYHGYPDRVAMAAVISAMERLDEATSAAFGSAVRSAPPPASPQVAPAPTAPKPAPPRPVSSPAPPPSRVPAADPDPVDAPSAVPGLPGLLEAAAASPLARTRALGARVAGLVDDLAELVKRDRATAEAAERAAAERDRVAREIAVLESRISQLRASVASAKKARAAATTTAKGGSAPAAGSPFVCDVAGCGRVFQGLQGLRMHRRRAHEGWGGHNAPARPPRSDTTLVEQQ